MRLLLRLPADSLLPGQIPAQESNPHLGFPAIRPAAWHRVLASLGDVAREGRDPLPPPGVDAVARSTRNGGVLRLSLPGPARVRESSCAKAPLPDRPSVAMWLLLAPGPAASTDRKPRKHPWPRWPT